jgi:hypothetical protein
VEPPATSEFVVVAVEKARRVQVEITAQHNRAMAGLDTNGLMVITTPQVVVVVTGRHLPPLVVVALEAVVVVVCAEVVPLVLVVALLETQVVMVRLRQTLVAVTLVVARQVQILVLAVVVMVKANIYLTQELVVLEALELLQFAIQAHSAVQAEQLPHLAVTHTTPSPLVAHTLLKRKRT